MLDTALKIDWTGVALAAVKFAVWALAIAVVGVCAVSAVMKAFVLIAMI